MPRLLVEGQELQQSGQWPEARQRFTTFLTENAHGSFSEGATFFLASLPDSKDEPGMEFLKQIERLQHLRHEHPNSHYAPWALCTMGELYWNVGWYSESNGLFAEFLQVYPESPLAGGVMIEAGRGYLENRQFLEAALIYRRVIEQPQWEAYRVKAALGLANATALSSAWKQASYWYQVVEAERPELIRQSPEALLNFGETQRAKGQTAQARMKYLSVINLHPRSLQSGQSLIRLSEDMFQGGHDYLGLWFAEQASRQFQGQEAGRRGQAALVRWVVSFLKQEPSKEDWLRVYRRLDDLEVYVSVSWDHVLESARELSQSPEIDLAEESALWMAYGYEQLGDKQEAIKAFAHLAVNGTAPTTRKEGQARLSDLLDEFMKMFQGKKDWVGLLTFLAEHQDAFQVLPVNREQVLTVAQAYQAVALPEQALRWYDRLLTDNPQLPFREEIMFRKVGLADELKQSGRIQEVGKRYLHDFPNGKWRGTVLTLLGIDAVRNTRFEEAIAHFTDALQHLEDPEGKRFVLRSRGRTYQTMNQMENAQLDYEVLVKQEAPLINDMVRLGDVLFDQGDYAEAIPVYQQVRDREISPEVNAWVTYRLGLTFDRMGNAREGEALLKRVREQEMKHPDVEHSIGLAAGAVLEEFSLQAQAREVNNHDSNQR
ncbi:MAG: tetratricopeptide repeat protein [Nitrospirales bacterium]|nr:tetratricopeptide repeat protein [Nitrospirales bacterium]